ncbi:MAG: IS66 family transposase [Acidobacteria bacterium]|nr:IS66 family transposase [Acidobacteriota bacterium]
MESSRRAGKRQAAPFSKGVPSRHPRRPGRKPGADYGTPARRPTPERIDEIVDAPLPPRCPDCRGALEETGVLEQTQTEIPEPQPLIRRIDIHQGRCRNCGRMVRGRHPVQTSEAVGAAASQLGPRALAMIAMLNKGLGLSFEKTARVMRDAFGIDVSRAGAWHAVFRTARAGEPTYQALTEQVRHASVAVVDETGWKVEAILRWLWVFATPRIVVYRIASGRGFEQAAAVLGAGYSGVLVRDGWAPYLKFTEASHQTCLAHLLRRCRELISDADRGQARVPHALARILKQALAVRDRRDNGELTHRGAQRAAAKLTGRVDTLLQGNVQHPPNVRLLKHIVTQHDHLFTFLQIRDVDATNFRAEQGVRPIVVTRKVWGGNRTWNGAHAQEVLCSVLYTCRLQDQDALMILTQLVCSSTPHISTIALEGVGRGPPR